MGSSSNSMHILLCVYRLPDHSSPRIGEASRTWCLVSLLRVIGPEDDGIPHSTLRSLRNRTTIQNCGTRIGLNMNSRASASKAAAASKGMSDARSDGSSEARKSSGWERVACDDEPHQTRPPIWRPNGMRGGARAAIRAEMSK